MGIKKASVRKRAGKGELSTINLDFYFFIGQGFGAESFGGDEDTLDFPCIVAAASVWANADIRLSVAITDELS